jgi:glucose/arabinose dehydrogenase
MRRLMFQGAALCICALANAQTRTIPSNVRLPGGYSMTAVAAGLNFPTAIAISNDKLWVAEAGAFPGTVPTIKQIDNSGAITTILTGSDVAGLLGPLTDVTFHAGWLWITHRQIGANGWLVGAISKFQPENPKGTFTTVLTNLPSAGDHYTEEIVFDSSGRAYFSQGSATNSSVVGADNYGGWLNMPSLRTFHDFAPKDIVLNGTSYRTGAPFPLDPDASMMTAPFHAFGSDDIAPGAVVRAATPATPQEGMIGGNGTVYSFDPDAPNPASTLRLEGWGFRNPYGIGFDPLQSDRLFVSNNGADYRKAEVNGAEQIVESRPVDNDWDDLFVVQLNKGDQFFGWPEFFHDPKTGSPLPATDPSFCVDEPAVNPCPKFEFDDSFRKSLTVQPAFAELEHHSSANKFDFSTDQQFHFLGDVFIAETGSFPPVTGAEELVGYKVVRVNRNNG